MDISQEVFNCNVFPGDPYPEKNNILAIKKGDICNLTRLSMCVHNGTHIDAPFHFIDGGKTVEQLGLDPFVGDCFVRQCQDSRYDEKFGWWYQGFQKRNQRRKNTKG